MTQDKIDWDGLVEEVERVIEQTKNGPQPLSRGLANKIQEALKVAKAQSEAVEKFDVLIKAMEQNKNIIDDSGREWVYGTNEWQFESKVLSIWKANQNDKPQETTD